MPPRRKTPPRSRELAALGEAIRRRRQELGWSQEELAEKIFTGVGQVGKIERGARNPSYQAVADLAPVLEMRLHELTEMADRILDEGLPEDHLDSSESAQTASTNRNRSASTPRVQP